MNKVTCLYFCKASGRVPVEEFICSLGMRTRLKFFYIKELLEEFGPELPIPHAKYLKQKIFELRFDGAEGSVRILYFFHRDQAVLTNGFLKKTNQTPEAEIKMAVSRREEYLKGTY